MGVCGSLAFMWDEQLHPIALQRFSSQPFNRCFALASATLVATMIMREHDQIEGLLGHVTFGAMKRRSEPCLDHCNQRCGLHHRIELLEYPHVHRIKLAIKQTCRKGQPRGTLASVIRLVLAMRWRGAVIMVPRQHACSDALLRHAIKKCGMHQRNLTKRDEDILHMGTDGLEQLGKFLLLNVFHEAQEQGQICPYTFHGMKPTQVRAQGQGFTQQTEQQIQLIISLDRVCTSLTGWFRVLKTLVQIGVAFGVGACLRCCDLLANGCLGFSLQLMAAGKQGLTRMELVTHPAPRLPRSLGAGLQADAPVGGHAKAVKAMRPEVLQRRFPGLGRAI